MKKLLLTLAGATALISTSANAAPTLTFFGGSAVVPGTIFQNFNGFAAGSVIGTNTRAFSTDNFFGARPAFGSTGNFASVLPGGSYGVTFAASNVFAFTIGSVDSFNKLTLTLANGTTAIFSGGQFTPPNGLANGNQDITLTNGTVAISANGGPLITGATFSSTGRSFEFDNLATSGVPEPAAWALMIIGFGAIGSAMRRQRSTYRVAYS